MFAKGVLLSALATVVALGGAVGPAYAADSAGLPDVVCSALLSPPPSGLGLGLCPSVVPYVVHRLNGVTQPLIVIGNFTTGDKLSFPNDPNITVVSSTVLSANLLLAQIIVPSNHVPGVLDNDSATLGGEVIRITDTSNNSTDCTWCGPDNLDIPYMVLRILKDQLTQYVCMLPPAQRVTVQNVVDSAMRSLWGDLDRSC